MADENTTDEDMTDGAPGPLIASIEEIPWVEVKAQSHGGRRVSVWEKFLEWSPTRLVVYARYDPGMVVERHGHASDHFVFVVAGEVTIGDRICAPGTHVSLERGAVFGPIVAGPEGATLYEIMAGDPRAIPADDEGFARLLAERGITPLPNPEVVWPEWLAARTDGDPGAPTSSSHGRGVPVEVSQVAAKPRLA